ncbi:xanthine dehydrogenase accessory protein XdhC [Novosphingobium sp.]|uniref:xanthine dehydrogenase accessory protein XdhC n=1 Tax=Novosphingobium sp. TaxID=1874826 RepID=UPI0025DB3DC6|nr:xanthine dehydrogenase accessory protein XdhC [Novosphingobium sp.]
MSDWLAALREIDGREPVAMVSVLATEGSAPRGAGTRMLVMGTALHGTIGGGQLEYRAVEQARAILALPPCTWRVQDYPLGPLLGQCCGGRVRLLVEHVDPDTLGWLDQALEGAVLVSRFEADRIVRTTVADPRAAPLAPPPSARGDRPEAGAVLVEPLGTRRPVWLFGAGHVGQAIARHASGLPLRLAWFDTRSDLATIDGVAIVPENSVEACVADAPNDAAVVILTHDHGLDYRLVRAALDRGDLAFVGLIGSATKRARFLSRLESDGIPAEARARLTSPIGIAGVTGKEPDVIAVGTLVQLLQLGAP